MTGIPTRARAALAPALVTLALCAAAAARADVFSPGELARPHAHLEGISNCTRCHVAGQQLSEARCLECHAEVRERIARGAGLHGRLAPAERACQGCHHEHQGRDFPLVDLGPGGKKGFDHARTGFALGGRHRGLECARCHDPRLVVDPTVAAALRKAPGRTTYLGAPTACASCHLDEHRGQLGPDCRRCHGEDGWRPAARFDHARTGGASAGAARAATGPTTGATSSAPPARRGPSTRRPAIRCAARTRRWPARPATVPSPA